ncbi:hypothetical protein ATN37_25490 [Rhodococcus sp. MH15]|nr:hypothetical protein [Rhodococcus sp. MH15]
MNVFHQVEGVPNLRTYQWVGIVTRMDHTKWMQSLWGDESVRSVARRSGVAPRSLANYVERGKIPAEAVISLAIAYGANPVGALVETGYLAPEYAKQVDPMTALRGVTDEQIADEVLRRMLAGSHPAFEMPIDEYAGKSQRTGSSDNVHQLTRTNPPQEVDDEIDDLDLPYVAHEPGQDIDEDDDESKYDI